MDAAHYAAPSTLEMLPNELLLDICKHLTARELYRTFYALSRRLRSIVDSVPGLYLTMTDHECHEPLWLAFRRVSKLRIEGIKHIDLRSFSNVRSLEWISPSSTQLLQMCTSTYFPQLCHLSVYDMPATSSTARFQQMIFSNGFPTLQKCSLSDVDTSCVWTLSPSLRGVRIGSVSDHHVYRRILTACPNLTRLNLRIADRIRDSAPLANQHINLQTLQLTGTVSLVTLEHILSCVPALIHLDVTSFIRTQPTMYLQRLSNIFNACLPCLQRFDCELLCNGRCEDMISIQPTLEQRHPCFTNRLRFQQLTYGRMRISTI